MITLQRIIALFMKFVLVISNELSKVDDRNQKRNFFFPKKQYSYLSNKSLANRGAVFAKQNSARDKFRSVLAWSVFKCLVLCENAM